MPLEDVPRTDAHLGEGGTARGLFAVRESAATPDLRVEKVLAGGAIKPVAPTIAGESEHFLRFQEGLTRWLG